MPCTHISGVVSTCSPDPHSGLPARPAQKMPSKICFQFQEQGSCKFGARCKFAHIRAGSSFSGYRSHGVLLISDSSSEGDLEDVADFFAEYPSFDYNPRKDVMKEFQRLCRHRGLDPEDKEDSDVRHLRGKLRTAMVRQFNGIYGTDEDDLNAWQALCRRVDIPVPDTVAECEEAIRGTHVNLVDLTTYGSGRKVTKYATEVELASYTTKTGKFFPRGHADAGGLLNKLLRHILNPRPEWQVRGIPRPRRGR